MQFLISTKKLFSLSLLPPSSTPFPPALSLFSFPFALAGSALGVRVITLSLAPPGKTRWGGGGGETAAAGGHNTLRRKTTGEEDHAEVFIFSPMEEERGKIRQGSAHGRCIFPTGCS